MTAARTLNWPGAVTLTASTRARKRIPSGVVARMRSPVRYGGGASAVSLAAACFLASRMLITTGLPVLDDLNIDTAEGRLDPLRVKRLRRSAEQPRPQRRSQHRRQREPGHERRLGSGGGVPVFPPPLSR